MIIYPILIALTRVGVIWVRSRVGKQILLSATQILIITALIHVHNKKSNDKKEY